VLVASIGERLLFPGHAATAAPTSPPVTWCENGLPTSPYSSAPAGAVTVPAGNNGSASVNNSTDGTTYWFAAGTHTGLDIQTGKNDVYMGAPGAIIDGGNTLRSAFTGQYNDTADQNVTIEYLTVQHYHPDQGGGSVNTNGNNGWTEQYDLMQNNTPGAAMMLGGENTVTNNCLKSNGEYGAQGYSYVDQTYENTFTGGALNITFNGNDVAANNTMDTNSGIEGGVKFWQNGNVTVTGNYFHDNIDSPGLWADTDNAGFLIQNNYFANNGNNGLMYEISYNAVISDNTFVGNAIADGPTNPGFPDGAIYISESGGDSRVPSNYPGILNIEGNNFNDNWAGVIIYQNSGRYSGDGQDPGPLIPPTGVDIGTWIGDNSTAGSAPALCPGNLSKTSPVDYKDLCIWKSQNVTVQNNQFTFNPSDSIFGGQCSISKSCGENGLFAPWGSLPSLPQYVPCNEISNLQNNHFSNNTYVGPWEFNYFNQGDLASFAQWQAGLTNVEGSGYNFSAQDAGSTLSNSPPPSTPNGVTATANSPTSVTVNWNASSDSGGPGLGGYRIYRGGAQVGSVNASTTSYTDTTASANTQYSYTAAAYDTATPANVSAQSGAAIVTTPASGQAPSLSLSLTTNSTVHGTSQALNVAATPVSGNTISQTQLFVDGGSTAAQTITTSPYNFTLNTLGLADGNHTITIKATDNHGNLGAQTITILVTNGDFNNDSKVGISDLAIMAGHWSQQTGATYSIGDINGDGKVTITDLSILANNWNKSW